MTSRSSRLAWLGLAALLVATLPSLAAPPTGRVAVGPARLSSAAPLDDTRAPVEVGRFLLDRRPITNGEFLAFVRAHPEWRRDRVKALFADAGYLSHWASPTALGHDVRAEQPVTRVSWFAARAYCKAHDGRLPGFHEWELAAAADERSQDARKDPAFQQRLLDWYARPNGALVDVGRGRPNVHGLYDVHGLVWEWVEDFSSLLVSADSREQGGADKLAFCGAGAATLEQKEGYAMFMRIAFLSALEARFTTRNLGFRCAADAPGGRR